MVLSLGFLSLVYLASRHQIPIGRLAWFFWSASFVSLPILTIFAGFEYFLIYWPSVKNSPSISQSSKAFIGAPIKFIVITMLTLAMSGIFHVVIGLFLSIMVPVEPYQSFAIEGFNNNFGTDLILYHLQNFSILWPSFILLKVTLLFIEPGVRIKGHGFIRDGLVPLLAGFLCSLIFKNILSINAILLFSAFIFLPWTALFGKDRFDKVATGEPEFKIPVQIPVEHTYRPNVSPFWGILLLFVSVLIMGLCLNSALRISQANSNMFIGSALVVLIGALVSAGFIFAAMNMLFAYRKVMITSYEVEVFEKAYFIVIPKIKSWKSSLSDFSDVKGIKKIFGSNSDTNAYYFVVQLINGKDSKKNIELYRANHSDEYLNVADQWKKLLNLKN